MNNHFALVFAIINQLLSSDAISVEDSGIDSVAEFIESDGQPIAKPGVTAFRKRCQTLIKPLLRFHW